MKNSELKLKHLRGFNTIDVLLMFLFVFNLAFVFLPEILRTRVLIGFIGFFVFFRDQKSFIPRQLVNLILLICLGLIIILLTTIFNNNLDPRFIGNSVQNVIYIFGAYYLVKRLNFDYLILIKVLVIAIFAHNLLALIMFWNISLLDFFWSFQHTGGNFENAFENTVEFGTRFIGLGIGSFFSGGMISSIGIILSAYLISVVPNKKKIWFFTFFFLAITSVFIARIAYLSILISVLYLIYAYFKKGNIANLPKILFIIILLSLPVVLFIYFNLDSLLKLSSFNHAFELLINVFSSGNLKTESTDVVKEMLIFPSELKTIIIGDAKFYDDDGSFYMSTDVGYSRLLFYFGIPGTISYFLIQIYISYLILKVNVKGSLFNSIIYLLLLLLFIGNIKGLLDFNWLMFLFFWIVVKDSYNFKNEAFSYN